MQRITRPGWSVSGRTVLAAALVALAALALAAWEGTLAHGSLAAHRSVLAVVGVAVVGALGAGWGRQRARSAAWARHGAAKVWGDLTGSGRRPPVVVAGTVAWCVLAAATVGWDLVSFVHQAHDLPTLSRLVGDVTRHAWGRALVFAAWMALGAYLVAGGLSRLGARPGGGP